MNLYINLINRVITVFKTKIVQGSFGVARSMRSYLLNYFTFYHFFHLSVFFIIHAAIFLYCFLCKYFRVLVCLIHPKKTEYVIFGTAMKRNQINSDNLSGVYLGEQALNCRPFYKYLGVYLDQSLSFKEHVTRLVDKVSRQLGLLSRVRNNLTVHAAERIFTAMILPKLNYCDFVWNNLAPSRYHALERFTNESC